MIAKNVRASTTVLMMGALLAALMVAAPAEARQVRPGFFGMHDGRVTSGALPSVEIGALRLWDTGTSWRQIEKRPGRFAFDTTDRAVDTARSAGARPLLVLGQTPRFHAQHRNAPGFYGRGATSMPRLRPWKRYVHKVARRYGNDVDYQVWNEPNVIEFWRGSPAQMARLTAIAGRIITRTAGRRSTVVAPSFPLRLRSQQKWYRAYWHQRVGGRGLAASVDVVSASLYPETRLAPEAQLPLLRYAKRALPAAARGKPFWNTEINYGLVGGHTGSVPRISARKQAAYVARTVLLNAAGPVRRMFWYSWNISSIANTHLSREGGARRTRAGRAWNEVREWLVRTKLKGCRQAHRGRTAGVYTCTARAGRHEVRRIYWTPSGRAVDLATRRSSREISFLGGGSREVSGRVRIPIGQAPVMVTSRR